MEDLWRLKNLGFRLRNIADRAEHDLLLRRFREEEEHTRRRELLCELIPFGRPQDLPDKK